MVKLYDSGVYLLNGKTLVPEKEAVGLDREAARKGTISYGILQAHNVSGDPKNLNANAEKLDLLEKVRGLAGFVVNGAVRDLDDIEASPLPVFALAAMPLGPSRGIPGAFVAPPQERFFDINL